MSDLHSDAASVPPPMGSVDKALLALEFLGDVGAEGVALSRLALALGMHKASLHRTLAALRHRNFVEQDARTGHYRLGPKMLALADLYLRDGSLRAILHDPLRTLSATINELCHLGVLSGSEIIYVDKVEPLRPIRVWSEIGLRNPALTTALGRAILSQSCADFEDFAKRFSYPIQPRTPFTPPTAETIWEEIVAAKRRGFAKEEQENEAGISCIGVAILRGDTPAGAISISALHERMPMERMTSLAGILRKTIEPHLPSGLSLQQPS